MDLPLWAFNFAVCLIVIYMRYLFRSYYKGTICTFKQTFSFFLCDGWSSAAGGELSLMRATKISHFHLCLIFLKRKICDCYIQKFVLKLNHEYRFTFVFWGGCFLSWNMFVLVINGWFLSSRCPLNHLHGCWHRYEGTVILPLWLFMMRQRARKRSDD